jgi:dUTP pyrophosphatase
MFRFIVEDPRVIDSHTGRVKQFLRGSNSAAGFDLVAWPKEPVVLQAGAPARLIPLGVKLFIEDPSYFGAIYPRSGKGHKEGLVMGNSTGIIDADYQGDLFVSALNRNQNGYAPIRINPGDRIAQIVFQRYLAPELMRVDNFETETSRGAGGFGSTGV